MKNFLKLLLALFLLPLALFVVAEVFGACWYVFVDFQNAVGFLAGAAGAGFFFSAFSLFLPG